MPGLLWSFGVGALGWLTAWLATNFVGKPLIDFFALRREIQEELTFSKDVSLPDMGIKYEYGDEAYDKERTIFDAAQTQFRKLGSKLIALNTYLFPPLRHLLRAMGFKIEDAAKHLLGLSRPCDEEERTVNRYQLEIALRFPHLDERHAKYVIEERKRRREAAEQRRKGNADQSS